MVAGEGSGRPEHRPEGEAHHRQLAQCGGGVRHVPRGGRHRCALAKLSEGFADEGWVNTWQFNEEGLAFYVNGLSFLATAAIIGRIHWTRRTREERLGTSGGTGIWEGRSATREGWEFIAVNPIVRAVNIGLATGVIGGGMLVPLGAIFVDEVIAGEGADFNLILFASAPVWRSES